MPEDRLIQKLRTIILREGLNCSLSVSDDEYMYHLDFANHNESYNINLCKDGLYVLKSSFLFFVFDDVCCDLDRFAINFTSGGYIVGGVFFFDNSKRSNMRYS